MNEFLCRAYEGFLLPEEANSNKERESRAASPLPLVRRVKLIYLPKKIRKVLRQLEENGINRLKVKGFEEWVRIFSYLESDVSCSSSPLI